METIKMECEDWAVCLCGNQPNYDGFYPCLDSGRIVEPDIGGFWNERYYCCERCHRIIDMMTGVVHGRATAKAITLNNNRHGMGIAQ